MNNSTVWWDILSNYKKLPIYYPLDEIVLSSQEKDLFITEMQKSVLKNSWQLVKLAKQQFDMIGKASGLYCSLNNSLEIKSALVAELFRNDKFILNSGNLDVLTIQKNVYDKLYNKSEVVFELAWGQAKRDAGFLKTPGPYADAGEFIALGRILCLMRAVENIIENPIKLELIPGGQRFYSALFVNKESDEIYNKQRLLYVEWLKGEGIIKFSNFNHYLTPDQINQTLAKKMTDVSFSYTEEGYKFVLFNVDWDNILSSKISPYDIPPPTCLVEKYSFLEKESKALLLRELLFGLVKKNEGNNSNSISCIFSQEILVKGIEWMEKISRLSTISYCSLGEITSRQVKKIADTDKSNRLLLTVIGKAKYPEIPNICTLSKYAGSNLPQHVTTVINKKSKLDFLPYIEVVNKYRPVYLSEDRDHENKQPFLFSDLDKNETVNAMKYIDFINNS